MRGNGFCFLQAVLLGLGIDYNYNEDITSVIQRLLWFLCDNASVYADFHPSQSSLISDAINFFQSRSYTDNIVDIIVQVVADCLHVDLEIYQEHEGKIQVVKVVSQNGGRKVRLKFSRSVTHVLCNHYDAIVKRSRRVIPTLGYDITDVIDAWEEEYLREHPHREEGEEEDGSHEESVILGAQDTRQTPLGNVSGNDGDGNDDEDEDILPRGPARKYRKAKKVGGCRGAGRPELFRTDVELKVVTTIPEDIDGDCAFLLKNVEDTWLEETRDLRYFQMKGSRLVDMAIGDKRRTGACRGNFCCYNKECPLLEVTGGDANRTTFMGAAAGTEMKLCKFCQQVCHREGCGARKIVHYIAADKSAVVHHFGRHRCILKTEMSKRKMTLQKRIERAGRTVPSMSARAYSIAEIVEHLKRGDMAAAKKDADLFADPLYTRRVFSEMRTMESPDTQSFDAVAAIKRDMCDLTDTFWIYKFNNGSGNRNLDYVFKSSHGAAQLALDMDVNRPSNPMRGAIAFYDGAHGHVQGFDTFCLWSYHSLLKRMVLIASMDIRTENVDVLTIFWTLVNEMLQEISGDPKYKFNPVAFFGDQAAANKIAIKNAFDETVAANKTAACSWHFKSRGKVAAQKVGDKQMRRDLLFHVGTLVHVQTVPEYEKHRRAIMKIGRSYANVANFMTFWHDRREMVFPPFRIFTTPGSNAAEAGNRMLTKQRKTLLDACMEHVAMMMMQDTAIEQLKTQRAPAPQGRGPSQTAQAGRLRVRQMNKAQEMIRSRLPITEVVREFGFSDVRQACNDTESNRDEELGRTFDEQPTPELIEEEHEASTSQGPPPKKRARRVATKKTARSSAQSSKRSKGRSESSAREVSRNIAAEVKQQIKVAEGVLGREAPPPVLQASLQGRANPPILMRFDKRYRVRWCRGNCNNSLDSSSQPPQDMCFRRRGSTGFKDKRTNEWRIIEKGHRYYHINWQCVKDDDATVEKRMIYIGDEDFTSLTPAHFQILKDADLLEYVISCKKL